MMKNSFLFSLLFVILFSTGVSAWATTAPVADAGGPYVVNEGSSIILDASASTDDGTIVSYEWDFDYDGITFDVDGTGVSPSVSYPTDQLATIGLRVTDDESLSSTVTATIQVDNVVPILTVTPGITILDEGETFTGSGSFVDPGDDTFTGSVDYGDGEDIDMTLTLTGKTFSLNHIYKKSGDYTVIVVVSDGSEDGTVEHLFDVTVNNVAPSVTPGVGGSISEGDSFSTAGSFSDPGNDDWAITVDYDDGYVDTIAFESDKTFEINHTFANDGTYDVAVSVFDGDSTTTESFSVLVTNVPPLVDAGPDVEIDEGSEFSSVGFVTDPGAESFTATVDYGDGSGVLPLVVNDDASFDLSHVYENDGVYSVSVLVSDGPDSSGDSVSVTVNNVIPEISVGSSLVDENRLYTSVGLFSDPGSDMWTGTVNYGDGPETLTLNPDKSFELNHMYSTNGAHTVTVSVSDGADTGLLSYTVGIFVSDDGVITDLNSPAFSSVSTTGSATFETDSQDIWGPVTAGSGVVSWDLFPFQSWNPSDVGFDGFSTILTKKFGIGMDMGTNGHLGMDAKVDDLKGTVDVFYDGDASLTHPDVNTFLAGDTTPISSVWTLNPSTTTINAGTTGDLQLDMDMKLNTFLDTEACFASDCTDVFSIPTINREFHPTLFKFDDSNPLNSVPDFVLRALLKTNAVFSNIDVDPSTSSVDVSTGRVMASDTRTFSTMAIDIDKIFTTLVDRAILCPSVTCTTLGESLTIDKTTLAYDYFDATSDIDFIANQKLTFDTGVLVQLDFERPVSGVLGSLVSVTDDGAGGINSVVYKSGDDISVTFPIDETLPITVTPTLLLDPENTRLHNFAKVTTDSDVTMSAGFANYRIQSFEAFPPTTISYPHILGHWHCHDRVLGVCYNWHSHSHTHTKDIGAINFPGVTLPTLGPLWNSGPQGNVMKVNVLSDDDFALGGFNTVQLDSFLLDPEVPPVAVIIAPPVNEGSVGILDASDSFDVDIPAQPLSYSWDLDNDGTFETVGITAEFTNTADGPATYPISLQVCDALNCDIALGTIDVLNVDPTVDAGDNQEAVIHDTVSLAPATFTDPGFDCVSCGTLEDFTSLVNWDDGSDVLLVSETPGSLGVLTEGTISGSHIYRLPGDYTVTVTVTDDDLGTGSDDFTTTVLGAADLKNRVIDTLIPFESDSKDVRKAIEKINKSLDAKLWIDAVNLDVKKGHKVFDEEKNAVEKLMKIIKLDDDDDDKKKSASPELKAAAQFGIDNLTNADRVLAITAMLDATSEPVDNPKDQKKVDKENERSSEEFDKGDEKRDEGDYDKAIEHYEKAWKHAQKAIKHAQGHDDDEDEED